MVRRGYLYVKFKFDRGHIKVIYIMCMFSRMYNVRCIIHRY